MRRWVAVGVAFLTLVTNIDHSEACARMRLPIGRTVASRRPSMPAPSIAQTGSAGRIGDQPANTVTPGRATMTMMPLAASGHAIADADPTARIGRPAVPLTPALPRIIREVRAVAPACGAGKRVRGLEHKDAGLCSFS